ncbi:MAG: hypothetical protein ACFCBU_01350 [Cyanophyceae cyanobacterium]
MNNDTAIYRFLAIALGSSTVTQFIGAIALTSTTMALSFGGLFALLLIAGGMSAIFKFNPGEWVMDGAAVFVGIVGGIVL